MQYYEFRIKIPVPDEILESDDKEFLKKYLRFCSAESIENAVRDGNFAKDPATEKYNRRDLITHYMKKAMLAMSDRELYDLYAYNFAGEGHPFNMCEWCMKKNGSQLCPDKCPMVSDFLREEL